MDRTVAFLIEHGYAVLFVWTLAERIGVPLPAIPVLLASGALAARGEMSLIGILAIAGSASLVADAVWFVLGRRGGTRVLRTLCKLSLEPDSCVRATEGAFARYGAAALLFAKFVPAFSVAGAPLAGMLGMRVRRFLAYDIGGIVLWLAAFTLPGFVFHRELEAALSAVSKAGAWLGVAAGLALVAYVGRKWWERRRFVRELAVAKISPRELRERIDRGEDVVVVDLRHRLEFDADPDGLPGARHIPVEEFEARSGEIPIDREVVLYCT